ncbi:ABC transporter permease [Bacillus sp. SD088]|uniref:ABC transporter permease n=1 Tax=Bacillus sp. SD088 TaxID=2782012 RepID=UPI001A96EA87|nr:ABC transporter permease [Bacillus sp. SD088]MBO0996059.1 ABC transporter permease [Bacillus sp. SD088]
MHKHHWKAILYKDLCDLRWNGQILFNLITGVVFVFVFTLIPIRQVPISFLIAFILGMLTMIMQGNMIVEEHEQRMKRGLIQAGFSIKDIVIEKMLITFMITSLVLIALFLFHSDQISYSLSTFLLALPMLLIILFIGTFIGLKTKNTIEVSLQGMPVILLYFFVEGLLMNSDRSTMKWLAIFPNYHLHYGIEQINQQQSFLHFLLVPLLWVVVVILLFIVWLRKREAH